MKTYWLIAAFMSCVLCGNLVAQNVDSHLATLTEQLASKIKEQGSKKVTVLDFNDLEGRPNEFGKYIAEQITVNFVMTNRSFTVVDRANLKSILAEYKLTETGLINKENAKKLGEFSGVEALVLGTITQIGNNMTVTAKIIRTDTADIIGGAKASFATDPTVQELMSKQTRGGNVQNNSPSEEEKPVLTKQTIGNLEISVTRLQTLQNGAIRISMILHNKSDKQVIAAVVGARPVNADQWKLLCSLTANTGDEYYSTDDSLTGIDSVRKEPDHFTDIQPNQSQNVTLTFKRNSAVSRNVRSYTLQINFLVNQNFKSTAYENHKMDWRAALPNFKLFNFMAEIKTDKSN